MKANPGGQIDLREVIGRDQLIEQIWDTLEQQSVRMNAERRIGKTTIIRKLYREPRDGWVTIFQDLEQYHTARDFSLSVYREVDRLLSTRGRTARRARELLCSLGGTEVGGILTLPELTHTAPWKEILSTSIQDLVLEREKQDQRTLFLWDEVPYMLGSIKEREGETVAMEVLDTLRALRQTHGPSGLRMVITGSIGLHHVIHGLKQQNYANAPLNDVLKVTVPPLAPEPARELAAKLLVGEGLQPPSGQDTAEVIARLADYFPFYIHHIVKALKQSGAESTPAAVEQVVSDQLLDAGDPWELNHYRERIAIYYGAAQESAVLGILDGIAAREQPTSVNDLLTELKGSGALDDREQLLDLLRLIEQDHYLSRDADGHYRFQFPLLRRWWCLSRGL